LFDKIKRNKTIAMTLGTLLLYIAVASALATFAFVRLFKDKVEIILVSFVQNFLGALFVFSGFVKVVDPLGTAYKMEQYFAEFESTFSETWFSFLSPIFPILSELSIVFSLVMIILEILLGIFLLLGSYRKFTSWAFFAIVLFFTFLTGFTYLTGYVPQGVNFFEFSQWGAYVASNMKVTDCGCFGDFLVLDPKVSFLKDVFLLVPSLFLIFSYQKMHHLIEREANAIVAALSTGILFVFALSNYKWDLPLIDFRPFAEGVNVKEKKSLEEEAKANVVIIDWSLKNKNTGEVVTLSYEEYMSNYKNYPKESWETLSQTYSEPSVKETKISEFMINNGDYNDVANELLEQEGYSLWIVVDKVKSQKVMRKVTLSDTTFRDDTLFARDEVPDVQRKIEKVVSKEVEKEVYEFEEDYLKRYKEKMLDFSHHAMEEGWRVSTFVGGVTYEQAMALKHSLGAKNAFFVADDILLKTIVRSNPGIVLLKDGKIVKKWHINKLPDFEEVKKKFIN
jgi:uncharacterized membrane protein YphA (DoxX/SURF4 family)/co-chaperonin GroES (HSP10)